MVVKYNLYVLPWVSGRDARMMTGCHEAALELCRVMRGAWVFSEAGM